MAKRYNNIRKYKESKQYGNEQANENSYMKLWEDNYPLKKRQ